MIRRCFTAAVVMVLSTSGAARAQSTRDSVVVRSSTLYERSAFWQKMFGKSWRPAWYTEIKVPVLDLGTFGGGLEPTKAGGNQSKTLRLKGKNGRVYSFRSVDKDVQRVALPADMRHTPLGGIIQDQTAAFHPAGSLPVSRLEDAVGIFNARPAIYFMPDDARLGEFRDEFKNMLGQIEERPEDGPKTDWPKGTDDIIGSENLFFALDKSLENRVDARQMLTARFIDFIIGDTDRGQDQWRWLKVDAKDSTLYRPIPRDRDYAFMRTEGFVTGNGMRMYAKMTRFGPEFPRLHSLTFMITDFDRSALVALPWAAWDSIVTNVQAALNDRAIDDVLQQFPAEQRAVSNDFVRAGLRGRRDALRDQAAKFYRFVAEDADVFGSDDDESADIERTPDGNVRVRISRIGKNDKPNKLMYDRTFKREETQEIRLYLERGDDRVTVRGNTEHSIPLRIVTGEGDDVLVDSSTVADHEITAFYDATGQNIFVKGPDTHVDERPYFWAPPPRYYDVEEIKEKPDKDPRKINEERRGRFLDLTAGYLEKRTGGDNPRTYGRKTGFNPYVGYRDGAGVILGFGPSITDFGFRRDPFETRHNIRVMGDFKGDYGIELNSEKHFEASPWALLLLARASELETNRFFGFGNDTPPIEEDLSVVMRDEVLVQPAAVYTFNKQTRFSAGPVLRLARPRPEPGGPADTGVRGGSSYRQIGLRADFVMLKADRSPKHQKGVDVLAGVSASAWDDGSPFGETHAAAKFFVPVGPGTVALRAGGKKVWGGFPLQEAAYIGGTESLRGFWWNRFAGDASAYGSAEVHLPLFRVTLLTRTTIGAIAFRDEGRTWLNNDSPGGWHSVTGGGITLATLGQALSLTYAKGEEGHLYIAYGMPF